MLVAGLDASDVDLAIRARRARRMHETWLLQSDVAAVRGKAQCRVIIQ